MTSPSTTKAQKQAQAQLKIVCNIPPLKRATDWCKGGAHVELWDCFGGSSNDVGDVTQHSKICFHRS